MFSALKFNFFSRCHTLNCIFIHISDLDLHTVHARHEPMCWLYRDLVRVGSQPLHHSLRVYECFITPLRRLEHHVERQSCVFPHTLRRILNFKGSSIDYDLGASDRVYDICSEVQLVYIKALFRLILDDPRPVWWRVLWVKDRLSIQKCLGVGLR